MKAVYKTMISAMAAVSVISCDLNKTPVFEECKSFAAFDKTSVVVNENAGTVSIPVTIASSDPRKVAVAYQTVDGNAKEGVNFRLEDASAVLAFDGKARTMNIVIKVIDLPGEYTGDLSFTVQLVDTGSIDLGANKSCTVRIADLDHPLASILGGYEANGEENWDGPLTWSVNFDKDPEDISVVRITGLIPGENITVYGNVSEDLSSIYIPIGQSGAYNSSYNWLFVKFMSGGYFNREGSLELAATANGWVMTDPEWGYGILAVNASSGEIAGWISAVLPEVALTKQ